MADFRLKQVLSRHWHDLPLTHQNALHMQCFLKSHPELARRQANPRLFGVEASDVHPIDVRPVGWHIRGRDPVIPTEYFREGCTVLLPNSIVLIQSLQLRAGEGCRQFLRPVHVPQDGGVVNPQLGLIINLVPKHAKHVPTHHVRIVVGNKETALTSTQVLGAILTESGHLAKGSHFLSLVLSPMGLAGILDHNQIVLLGNSQDLVQISRQAVEMHRENGLSPVGDLLLDLADVDVVGPFIDIHEDGDGVRVKDAGG